MKLHIPLPPAHYQRPRPNRSGGFYSPHSDDLESWQGLIKNQMRLNGEHILEGPVRAEFHIGAKGTTIVVEPIIGSQPARPKGVRADIDNIEKFQADALQGFAYFDDVQIVDLSARFVKEEE